MRTRTVIERVGEYLGPVDWSFDFWSFDWHHGGGANPSSVAEGIQSLIRLTREPDAAWLYMVDPWYAQPIGAVGMYDGWPYWRPVPSIVAYSPCGAEWHSFCGLRVRKAPAPSEE